MRIPRVGSSWTLELLCSIRAVAHHVRARLRGTRLGLHSYRSPAARPLPELPNWRPRADLIGRTAALPVDLAVEALSSAYQVAAQRLPRRTILMGPAASLGP